jgi:hypothetical protein
LYNHPGISMRRYARIVHRWVERTGLGSSAYGTPPIRGTKAAQIYKKTGNLRVHAVAASAHKLENAVRYLGLRSMTR